jgi:hypothetical protein
MASWSVLTVAGVTAQWAGIPTAGGRLLLYVFPITVLVGVLAWRAAEGPPGRTAKPDRVVAGLVVVAALTAGFGAVTVAWRARQHPWIDPKTASQITASAAYLRGLGGDSPVVFVIGRSLSGKPSIQVVRAVLPPSLAVRAVQYFGTPAGFLSGAPPELGNVLPPSPRSDDIAISLQGLGPKAYRSAVATDPGSVIAPGVAVVQGPSPAGPLAPLRTPEGNTGRAGLVTVPLLVLGVLVLAGGGWSLTLLPPDPVVRVGLAPALGIAVISLATLAWDRLGLPLTGDLPLIPLVLSSAGGWLAALWLRLRPRRTPEPAS